MGGSFKASDVQHHSGRKAEGECFEQGDLVSSKDRVDFEALATRLHGESRRRTNIFRHRVMADKVMDVMLSALIVHEQGGKLSRKAAAMANDLTVEEADTVLAELGNVNFLRPAVLPDHVELTSHGVDRMRAYLLAVA